VSGSPLFRGACWQNDVDRVIQNIATKVPEETFLATHVPVQMRWQYRVSAIHRPAETDEEGFLRAFMDEPGHCYAIVVGVNGTGKSHLVRWIATRVRSDERRRVILVSRVNSNLKSIIRQILDSVDDAPELDALRLRLEATLGATEAGAPAENLLNAISVAIGPSAHKTGILDEITDPDERERIDGLMRDLPPLFQSRTFSQWLMAPGGPIPRLLRHSVGSGAGSADDDDLVFHPEDLRTALDKVDTGDLDALARAAYGKLLKHDGRYLARALAWINLNLRQALRSFIKFNADDLNELLLQVRRRLKVRDMELVLLIEDFAKTMGLDHALLEAVLVEPDQIHDDLCPMRSLFAVTPGFLENSGKSPETLRQRVTLFATLDVPEAEGGHSAGRLGARYLNAARLTDREIVAWGEHPGQPVPNACDRCPLHAREDCHRTFGEIDGFGLYPFNATALERMYLGAKEVVPETRGEPAFLPRVLLNHVLFRVLTNHRQDVQEGNFPPGNFVVEFEARRMPGPVRNELRAQTSGQSALFDRLSAVYELWGDPETRSAPDLQTFAAFGLPFLSPQKGSGSPVPPRPPTPAVERESEVHRDDPQPTPEDALRAPFEEIDDWSYGKKRLRTTLETQLQSALYLCVQSAIPWDDLHLLPRPFLDHELRLFSPSSLVFERSSGAQAGRKVIQTQVPPPGMMPERAAMALQGLLEWQKTGRVSAPEGAARQRALAELIDRLVDDLVPQFRQGGTKTFGWDIAQELAKVALVGARLWGVPLREGGVGALFFQAGNSENHAFRCESWRKLQTAYLPVASKTRDLLLATVGCTKGQSSQIQFVDGQRLLPIVAKALETIAPRIDRPKEGMDRWLPLDEYERSIRPSFAKAVEDEHAQWIARYDRLRMAFVGDEVGALDRPYGIARECTIATVLHAVRRGKEAGIVRKLESELQSAAERLRRASPRDIEAMLEHEAACRAATTPLEMLTAVQSPQIGETLYHLSHWIEEWTEYLSELNRYADIQIENRGHDVASLQRKQQSLEATIGELIEVAREFAGREL